jgi:hypothetical protein
LPLSREEMRELTRLAATYWLEEHLYRLKKVFIMFSPCNAFTGLECYRIVKSKAIGKDKIPYGNFAVREPRYDDHDGGLQTILSMKYEVS